MNSSFSPTRFRALVAQSLRQNRLHFALSGLGVAVGIATLVFFTALGQGVRTQILERVFVIGQLEVIDPTADAPSLGGLFGSGGGLNERMVQRVRDLDEVAAVFPKQKITFPASARGGKSLLGSDLTIEFIADGIPENLVDEDLKDPLGFTDHAAPSPCTADADCATGLSCAQNTCQPLACRPDDDLAQICGAQAYCHPQQHHCAWPIPVLAHPNLIELYNASLRTALKGSQGIGGQLPHLSEDLLVGLEFELVLGQSFLGRAGQSERQLERARLVGFSERAMPMGATLPLSIVQRLNAHYSGDDVAGIYHSLLVEAAANDQVPSLTARLTDELGLKLSSRHQQAERVGLLILLITLLFNLIALIILGISALNITHTFSMMVLKRRAEFGLMRALGATRRTIHLLVLGEATIVALLAALAGLAMGWLATLGIDLAFAHLVGDFPFKPDSLFGWRLWMPALGFGTALIFCWLGALIPARRAGHISPAAALTGR
ncbi:hypothetical protein DL240_00755 [Lujinxingia litoralis]|uniref:ABC3 transporter permease C-terminal domain-containing protein n=1 Tax=Lujinxingia litoralis TaxID=2211119 RepID=A0A328C9I9_9DELT|nr:ABC transporter permease [Lujinxingia litoralis]RAL24772.1 hypothetical protein DL240_00755 [Lujinxingia litoralis]